MKTFLLAFSLLFSAYTSQATIHTVQVWDGYYQFLSANITIQLGDTVQWLPLDPPTMVHTITSTTVPTGSIASFNYTWQAPADTFFQFIPDVAGVYNYECTPHVNFGMVGSITVQNTTTSVSKVKSKEEDFYVYPNPTINTIQFSKLNTIEQYRLFDIHGKILLVGKTDEVLDISSFSKGMYWLEIIGDRPRLLKVIKR
ncbi:MAG: T9SS type A sorting domain-containing protein [Aureispira sp.]|nr:T9SS type A sorting domain-containing protein [Aureispira sp.]